jgi:hypothetical protein
VAREGEPKTIIGELQEIQISKADTEYPNAQIRVKRG